MKKNVLFISELSGNLWAGPNNSVPEQVRAQSRIDNVFWYNINDVCREEWKQDGLNCQCLKDFPNGRLGDLPEPFNRPDIAIVEGFYSYFHSKIIHDLQRNGIPYIIVPRSQLTELAQKNKWIKKKIANALFFNSMVKKSAAIQYLTEQEKQESIGRWKHENFVVPNGIYLPENKVASMQSQAIRATYIGRVEIYQKGLDMLLEAIVDIQNLLRENKFQLSIYGPNIDGAKEYLEHIVSNNGINDIVCVKDAVIKAEKENVLLDTDLFVMSSRFEGLPMGLIEALAYGIPSLVTNGTNMADKIEEYDAGWSCGTSTLEIENALKAMLNEKDKLLTYKSNAVQLAKLYSWESIAEETHSILTEILVKRERTIR